jgi:hypothetical protein
MKAPEDDEKTGLPGLRTWSQVYLAVIVIFAAWVALLAVLGHAYS